jgi:hypothetical protein
MSMGNLAQMFAKADRTDLAEGMVAYDRYNIVMRRIAKRYDFPLDVVCAVFCSLSPNSDYVGNLRSTVSVLYGLRNGTRDDDIIVSTYGHCKTRALSYARRPGSFVQETRGPKILNFYFNILKPHSWRYVTIDGHMVAIWRNEPTATMKQSIIRNRREYDEIAEGVKRFAFYHYMIPNQMQAILWFVRKRTLNVKYSAQLDLLTDSDDAWKTLRDVDEIMPYSRSEGRKMSAENAIRQESFL